MSPNALPARVLPEPVHEAIGRRDEHGAIGLHRAASARQRERQALATRAPHALMARAGLAVARLALALQPHARTVWIACGHGNNGGDGLEAAIHLQQAGRQVLLQLLEPPAGSTAPDDARLAQQRARDAGLVIHTGTQRPPGAGQADLVIDALLGRGLGRPAEGPLAAAIEAINDAGLPTLAVDLPSGLPGDGGHPVGPCVRADWTLALLTLAPGLFTGAGRDLAGEIWQDPLGTLDDPQPMPADARLNDGRSIERLMPLRPHALHKGSSGDVLVIGGARGMGGAAMLAARAALVAGAGRVHLHPLDPQGLATDPLHPELMHCSRPDSDLLARCTVVAGCGGATDIIGWLPELSRHAARLVLDADALNALAADPALLALLHQREAGRTVITPHPLEAARLLGRPLETIQQDRLAAAQELARRCHAVVVLKGSGSVIAAPGRLPWINTSGSAALATAGSGDVLAGWLGASWSRRATLPASPADPWQASEQAARLAVHLHGQQAQRLSPDRAALPASRLAEAACLLRPRHPDTGPGPIA